jgi:hypothetical protein
MRNIHAASGHEFCEPASVLAHCAHVGDRATGFSNRDGLVQTFAAWKNGVTRTAEGFPGANEMGCLENVINAAGSVVYDLAHNGFLIAQKFCLS